MIDVKLAQIEQTAAQAIIRPVSAEWTAVTPAMRRLELAAGAQLEEQCNRLGELPVGSAVITTAGALPAQFIVHAVVRAVDEPVSKAGVRRALQNALRRVGEWGIESVAIAPMGTGAGNLDAEESAQVMFSVLTEAQADRALPAHIEIVVDSEYEASAFARQLARQFPPAEPVLSPNPEHDART